MFLKKNLRSMSNTLDTYRDLLAREMRGPSDTERAMHRIQAKYGIDYWQQWSMRFRPPKKLAGELMERVRHAYLSSLETSVRRDIAKLQVEAAKGDSDASLEDLINQAQDVLTKIAEKMK